MSTSLNRRNFVRSSLAIGTMTGLGGFAFLGKLPAIQAHDEKTLPETIQFDADVEPLVRLIETTSREKVFDKIVAQIHSGISYQQLLSAVFLAGIRNIQPRPVGFEFHCVLAVHSAHLAAMAASDGDRWLALFWALDNFKQSQAVKQKKGAWAMPRLLEGKAPSSMHARESFIAAMDAWDPEGADPSIAVLARTSGANELLELFTRYGSRDFRDIGHKAIYVANAFRTLNTIGWRHAEAVLRSVTFALLHCDSGNPAKDDLEPDRPWRDNLVRAKAIRDGWQRGKVTPEATNDILAVQRSGSVKEVCDKVVELLNREVDPASVWDGLFITAGELLMRQRGIVALHSMTSMNALHWLYQTSGTDETRRLLMLQAAAFASLFRRSLGRPAQQGVNIDAVEQMEIKGPNVIDMIFANASKDRLTATRQTLSVLQQDSKNADAIIAAGRRLVFNKGRDSHDYKFSSAIMEDFYHITPHWRNRYLASSMFWLHGTGDQDNELILRTRGSLATVRASG